MSNKKIMPYIPSAWWLALLTSLLTAAHFSRAGENGWTWGFLLFPFLLLNRRKWHWQVMAALFFYAVFEWIVTIYQIALVRMDTGQPWLRMAMILGAVVLFTLWGAIITMRHQRKLDTHTSFPEFLQTIAFICTFVLLTIIEMKSPLKLLLLERFLPGYGALEIFIIAYYAGWLTGKMIPAKETAKWRYRLWAFFSIAFFTQFILGLTVSETFMQTGKVHLPIPAVIIGGPLFRGGGSFMLILLLSTIVLAGPAWCSHLCYVGALDQYFSKKRKKAAEYPIEPRQRMRISILIGIIIIAAGLNFAGVSVIPASIAAIVFAVASIAVMVWRSAQSGIMVHCTSICPIGWITTFLGRVNPFRIKINDHCTDCGVCTMNCRYGSLNKDDISKRQPNISCTLCGDCIGACPHDALQYQFAGATPVKARYGFLVLIITLHSVFLAIARV